MLKPLPVGIQTFRDIINGGFLYVDKTRYIYELIRHSKGVYFLSRPRRFGKSLLLSTLDEIFQGNKELFKGLWLHDSAYQWQKHPILRLDFSLHRIQTAEELEESIKRHLRRIAKDAGFVLEDGPYYAQFEELIRLLSREKQVVILVDEYDKPILDNINQSDEAMRIRDVLKGFYTVIKGLDANIRFVMLTGVSKFSRVGVFSGLNNLSDLTFRPYFATALGITEAELGEYFQEHIQNYCKSTGTAEEQFRTQIRQWYNGFCFAPDSESVYNPFSTLRLFEEQRFSNFWFETGSPTFLIKLITERDYDIQAIEKMELSELSFSTYEIENLEILPLLFQSGYLTIKEYNATDRVYKLYYPNYEVENAFLAWLLGSFSAIEPGQSEGYLVQLVRALRAAELENFFEILQTFFAQIPYTLHLKHEKYYQTIFYLLFTLIGLRTEAEVTTNQGRIDAVVEMNDAVYLFEFKLDGDASEAIQQIKSNHYYQRYQQRAKKLLLIGVNFDSTKRTVGSWQLETENPHDNSAS